MTARRAVEIAAAGLGLATFAYGGWDGALWDARWQLGLHLAAVAALGGLVVIGLGGGRLPRTPIDLPVIGLVAAFGLATLFAQNPGLSAPALAGITTTAAMLPVALLVLRHRPGVTAIVVTLPIIGLAAGALAVLGWRRVEWLLADGPGLPPIRYPYEGTPFGSVAVAPFVIVAALPIALLIPHRTARLATVLALAAVGIPLTILSGSRSALLAIGVAAAVLLAPAARRQAASLMGRRSWTPRRAGLTALGGIAAVLVLAYLAPRLTDVTSLIYRGYLWRDTIAAWSTSPLLGIGPGAMPYARQAAAPPFSFPVQQPHSHDVPLGILGDAGLVGLAVAIVLLVAFIAAVRPWRLRRLPGRAAFAVLAGFTIGSLFEDLTFVPAFNLLVLLLAGMVLLDAEAVAWHAIRQPSALVAPGAVAALALAVVMLVGDGAAVAYRLGTDAAGNGHWANSEAWLRTSVALNPMQPTGPKALAVAADRAGHPRLAREAAGRAVALSPGDSNAWTNLALLCLADQDAACAREAATRAAETATPTAYQLANAAIVLDQLGDAAAADDDYRLSLLTNLWTGLTMPWPRPVSVDDARVPELGTEAADLNLLVARRVAGEPIVPDDYSPGLVRALAYAMLGQRAVSEAEAARSTASAPGSLLAWEVAALLAEHDGRDPSHTLRISDVLRGRPLATGKPGPAGLTYDIATFRAYPGDGLVGAAQRLIGDRPLPWVLEPLLAPAE